MKINRSNAKQIIMSMLEGYKTGTNEAGDVYYIMTLTQYNDLKAGILSNATKELAKYIDKYSYHNPTSPANWEYNASIRTYESKYALIKVIEDSTEVDKDINIKIVDRVTGIRCDYYKIKESALDEDLTKIKEDSYYTGYDIYANSELVLSL